MIIQVTAEDIKNGTAANCTICPIAIAIKRTLSKLNHIVVLNNIVVFNHDAYVVHQYIKLPLEAIIFIENYDSPKHRHLAVPFEFELDYVAAPSN